MINIISGSCCLIVLDFLTICNCSGVCKANLVFTEVQYHIKEEKNAFPVYT